MSQSAFIDYRGTGFWAFDVVTKILLKHVVDVAEPLVPLHTPWLDPIVYRWRVDTIVSDYGFELDDNWSETQVHIVMALVDSAAKVLASREAIPAHEIEGWELLNGNRIFARGLDVVRTRPIIQLANAVISLLNGSLPPSPPQTWWWYGIEDNPGTIRKREDLNTEKRNN